MQLVAYGAQDIYLTGNPQITFFKVVYRRHTNFSMESIEQTLNGSVGFGNRVSATISRNGDLVHNMYLEMNGASTTAATCANLGTALIDNVECEIGGQKIDKHYGKWMEVWSELTEPNPTGHSVQMAASGNTVMGTNFQNMSLSGGVGGETTTAAIQTITLPLQFWFCRNPGLALPLIALQYHEVKIVVTFQQESQINNATDETLTAKLWADYIYLDTDERRRFAQVSHEYLIEQVQYQTNTASNSVTLNFNHPVKELVFTGGVTTATPGANDAEGPSTPLAIGGGVGAAAEKYKLVLNGHDRFAPREYFHFTQTQVWQHHSGYGGITATVAAQGEAARGGAKHSIGVYSFALKPEEHQPSGTCNFSRIDNAQFKCTQGTAAVVDIYAVNYNVLRIMSGMGGLAYSN